jgi:hypothetical protein
MQTPKKKAHRKLLLAVPVVWSVITVLQAAATADDGGQADAGADSGTTADGRDHLCSVAPAHGAFGTTLGAGCC